MDLTLRGGSESPTEVRWVVTEVEVVDAAFDPEIDGPSNAQVLWAGLGTRQTLRLLLAVELVWIFAQLAARWRLGTCIDPPPFPLLHRTNFVLVVIAITLRLRARRDARERKLARRVRDQLREARAAAVRAAIADDLARYLANGARPLH